MEQLGDLGIYTVEFTSDLGVVSRDGGFDFWAESIWQRISLSFQDDTLFAVRVSAEGPTNEELLKTIWTSFSPESVLKEYDSPSKVLLEMIPHPRGVPPASAQYGVWVFYQHLGFALHYIGSSPGASPYQLCAVFGNRGSLYGALGFYAVEPTSGIELEDYIGEGLGTPESLWRPEEVSELNLEDFASLISRAHEVSVDPCFEASPR